MQRQQALEVGERKHITVSTDDLRPARKTLFELIQKGIISAEEIDPTTTKITARGFVGECLLGERVFRITEKAKGATAKLLELCSEDAFNLVDLDRDSSSGDSTLRGLIVRRFLDALSAYSDSGRSFTYESERRQSACLGGSLLVGPTLTLRASGRPHLFEFESPLMSHDTREHCAIYLGLIAVERLAEAVTLSVERKWQSRSLCELFLPGHSHSSVLDESISGQISFIRDTIRDCNDDRIRQIMRLALMLVTGESLELTSTENSASPLSWFIKLHDLFEGAIREGMRKVAPPTVSVVRWNQVDSVFLLNDGNVQLEPDLVIISTNESMVVAIGDVKYKDFDGAPNSDDLKKVILDAINFKANVAFLVYPGDCYRMHDLGPTTGLRRVLIFEVPIFDMRPAVAQMATAVAMISL